MNEGGRRGFSVLYDPFAMRSNDFHSFFSAADHASFFRLYPYDITPVTDDNPFFFLQHRWKDLRPGALFEPSQPLVEIPGKLLLLIVLAISLLFSVVLLLAPMFAGERAGLKGVGSMWLLLYFFGVGVAFMLVEILLMQRFSLFLGHPVYAISLVLSSLLVFSGFGSLVSRRLVGDSQRRLGAVVGILGVIVLLSFAGYPALFRAFLGQSFSVRVVVSLAGILPMCVLMGVPFPAAIRFLHGSQPKLIPWAWAVNGFASVANSSLCVLLAVEFGFAAAVVPAGACYLACGLVFLHIGRAKVLVPATT